MRKEENSSYARRREALYGPLRAEGVFTWDCMYGQEYALADVYPLAEETVAELRTAAERLSRIYARAIAVVRQAPEELLGELGVPRAAWRAVRLSVLGGRGIPTVVGRFDFALTADGVRMLEFNSDTPTGIVEAYHVNGRICRHDGLTDPNEGMSRHFREAFGAAAALYAEQGLPDGEIIFSALGWHEEDVGTTRYLLAQSGLSGSFAPLEALRVYEDRLHVLEQGEHRPVGLLYRLHALEKLAEDRDTDGYPTGEHVLELIADGRVAVLNPPEAFLAQTKAMQALIWTLHEEGEFFTEEEHEAIARYMLPTYLENRFEGTGRAYVRKPVWGREGGGVTLIGPAGEVLARDEEPLYWDQPMVYQQLAELPETEVETLQGRYSGHLLLGTFCIGGVPSAILARVGGRITGNLSYYLPVAIKP
ncbi:glutathionylspermidine synthase [Paenibacillus sp. J31TS4]|uniref:glutathionylspermidine synthase family protein n=1 Tax=Paenibacillus sp. J31TS4 TaxID=2807195 RepID=UPI001B29A251|nr:glutathionylspermidine synthase family protein [Paenibacillus sp. J31TS4]GIP40333.1 glutathionylspermidine synthase [Paenibacillus sp. J31TS4]